MKKIDIAAILSPDLKSRMRAQDLKALVENSGADAVSRTQVRAKVIPSQSQEVAFKDVKDFLNYFSTVVL